MTTADRTLLIVTAVTRHDALERAFEPIIAAFKNHDFPAFEEAWRTFDAYLAAISAQLGDADGWLQWFIHDNDCGRKKMEARAAAWPALRPIRTPRDLARLIEADLPPRAPRPRSAP